MPGTVTPPTSERGDGSVTNSSLGNGSLNPEVFGYAPGEDVSMVAVRENAERMLENVQKRSQRMGTSFAHIIADLQLRSKRQMQSQVKHLEVYHDAVGGYTDALKEAADEMTTVVKNVNFLDTQLEQMKILSADVADVLEAVKELDKVVTMLEKKQAKH
eukprot:TRINITY_DN816_c0_g1_i1.p1 TRINITY_DN816_c0_g1~~TRINITY_DN816_c0_g1_i1.p1  ORF type:complete len:159 (+),score=32.12 TRINITY_DN816_c0_g1_i1:43-519(+)